MTMFADNLKAQAALRKNFELNQVDSINGYGWHRIFPDSPTSKLWLTVNVTIMGTRKDAKIGTAHCGEDIIDGLEAYVFGDKQ